MSKFCFYSGEDPVVIDRLREAAEFCWEDVKEFRIDSFRLFIAADDCPRFLRVTDTLLGSISGYAENLSRTDRNSELVEFFSEISDKEWPLGDEWTGSFAAVVYSAANREVTLCNDLLGHFPLYYSRAGDGLIGGTNLIALGRTLDRGVDAVGVLQRITAPFCNYGRRTPLKKVYRLLPGERLKWKCESRGVRREFDNTLYGSISDADLHESARAVFNCLRSEVNTVLRDEEGFSVATSGGWDSRLILGALPAQRSSVNCLTYGSDDLYETKIARRCAEAVGASHESFPLEGKYFPTRKQIEPLVRETESANYFEWFGMIEKARSEGHKPLLLLGDLTESIDGRYMTTFSSRKARVRSFVGGMVGKREVFEASSDAAFARWREEKKREITSALMANVYRLSADMRGSLTETQLAAEIERDLETSFARVAAHEPPFAAMYDELFIWLHRIRFLLGNQLTWLGSAFRPASPGLSIRFLRLISTIHPRHKIRRRLMNAMIEMPEFDRLARIPSAQIPFLSSRAPALMRDAVWGLRSGIDQLLIKRTLRNKDHDGRQRVLRSLNYVKEYRRRETAENVGEWFSGQYVDGSDYLRIVRDRAGLDAWTLINVDIAAPANMSMVLDLCQADVTSRERTETAAAIGV